MTTAEAAPATETRTQATDAWEERQEQHLGQTSNARVGSVERCLSLATGAGLAGFGVYRRGVSGVVLGLTGVGLAARGLTGRDPIYSLLGINTAASHAGAAASVRHKQGVRVERVIRVQRPPEELYRFWRDLENLPRFMRHLESVQNLGGGRSHWVAKAPAGRTAEWDAEIIAERPNELIAWRSVEGSTVNNAGSVRFRAGANSEGTRVIVELEYEPPAGRLGALLGRPFGEEPAVEVREDLRAFKELMEAGEVATTTGQPSGRKARGSRPRCAS
jgi:uncharacterized membrane protein